MTNTKNTKRALLSSVMALFLSFAMLLGTTYAWFTDSVTSGSNIIQSGMLDVEMYWVEGEKSVPTADADWKDASAGAIFDYDKWEPGYAVVRHIKIANEGTLALKYKLAIVANGAVSDLADVIDVYYLDPATQISDRAQLTDANKLGTLTQVLANLANTANGELLANENDTITLALKMQETAGNEYQNKSIGTSFSVQLLATQLTYEKDSFDDQYDADAPFSVWNGTIPSEMPETLVVDPATRTITVNDAAAFAYVNALCASWETLYTNGQGTSYSDYAEVNGGKGTDYYYKWGWDLKLNCDIDLANKAWTPINFAGFDAVDGQGHTIKNVVVKNVTDYAGLFADVRGGIANITVENVSINAGSGVSVGAVAGNANGVISNVTVKGAIVNGNKYVGGIIGYGYASVINSTVSDSVITIADGGQKEAGGLAGYLCTSATGEVKGNTVKNTVISAPTVASALVSQPNGKYDISNNDVEGVTVTTSDDTADIFVSNNVGGTSTVAGNTEVNCTVNKTGTLTKVAFTSTVADTKTALYDGANYIDAQGANLGEFTYVLKSDNVSAGETVTIKNATLDGWNYGNAVAGTVVFDNCKFTSDSAYSIHFDAGNGYVVFNNCELEGWCSFGSAIKGVAMNNCTIKGNGIYSIVRCYQDFTMTNCVIDASNTITDDVYQDGIDVVEGYTATMVGCTNVNGSVEDLFEAEDIAGTDGKVIIK